jgi:hypothetical protein
MGIFKSKMRRKKGVIVSMFQIYSFPFDYKAVPWLRPHTGFVYMRRKQKMSLNKKQ